ncbi:hypothetical protein Pmani_028173 [Petrolisthes manimaculis]|uniref:Uncharacterized protein n=1 Tax=Petrolisthes manimaculis TaxID=1843537 RepID=A0AAE1P2N1_9EUCA|nr:hypothetical protein Pmani_028173 [Petrolisthes manimaculis]
MTHHLRHAIHRSLQSHTTTTTLYHSSHLTSTRHLHYAITSHLSPILLHALLNTHTFHLNKTDGASPSAMVSATRPNCPRLPEGLYRGPSCRDPLEGDGYHGCRWRGASRMDRAGDNSDTGREEVTEGNRQQKDDNRIKLAPAGTKTVTEGLRVQKMQVTGRHLAAKRRSRVEVSEAAASSGTVNDTLS